MKRGTVLLDGNVFTGERFELLSLRVVQGVVSDIEARLEPDTADIVVPLNGLAVVPGLINSHDHLEFNLFSHLGHPPYQNYVQWADDIQNSFRTPINQVLAVPLRDRFLWGAYKNIFSGVTTVIHHNDFNWRFRFGFPLEVHKNYRWIHSLRLEKRPLHELVRQSGRPVFIHLAEGIDEMARSEIRELDGLGGLNKETIIVHGVGIGDADIPLMDKSCGLVWCPGSNRYLFGATAPVEQLVGRIPVALGTDSTLTGPNGLFEEIRIALQMKNLSPDILFHMVTSMPARMIGSDKGSIARGSPADLLIFDARGKDPMDAFVHLNPTDVKFLLKNGSPIFGDREFLPQSGKRWKKRSLVRVCGKPKFVLGDFNSLLARTKKQLPASVLPEYVTAIEADG
ncbi:MAG: amidohydrolase family protein [Bacteroidota bacterium]